MTDVIGLVLMLLAALFVAINGDECRTLDIDGE